MCDVQAKKNFFFSGVRKKRKRHKIYFLKMEKSFDPNILWLSQKKNYAWNFFNPQVKLRNVFSYLFVLSKAKSSPELRNWVRKDKNQHKKNSTTMINFVPPLFLLQIWNKFSFFERKFQEFVLLLKQNFSFLWIICLSFLASFTSVSIRPGLKKNDKNKLESFHEVKSYLN